MRVGAMKEEKKIRKKIKIEDLLPRDPVRVDLDAVGAVGLIIAL